MRTVKSLWKKWLAVARVIGNFQGQVIMTIFYLVLMLPFGLITRIFVDSLHMKSPQGPKSNFGKWKHPDDDLESAHRQY